MKRILVFLLLLWGTFAANAQTIIAKQSFETSGDTWSPLSFSTPPCTVGNDVWNYVNNLPGISSASDGSRFWGIRDLNGSCGGNGFETISFPNVNISSSDNVIFAFDYNAISFENTEDLKYELFYNNVSQGEVIVVNGVNGNSDNTNGWQTETVNIPNTVTNVRVVLSAKNNHGSDRGGFDNVRLFESSVGNDSCTNATTLIVGTNNTQNIVSGDNTNATSSGELPNPSCGNYVARDIWYTASVPSSGTLTVEVTSTQIDPAVAIYTGSCGNLTQVACNDDINVQGGNLNSRAEITGYSNTTVLIRVWSYNNQTSGIFDIVAFSTPPPTNNDCLNATTLTVGSSNSENVVTATNEGATGTNPAPSPNCDGYQGGDVWFTAQIPASGILNIETSNVGGITDTGVAVYTGSCGSLTQIACDADSGSNFFSLLNLTGLPNTTVYIRVWEYLNNDFGEFNIVAWSPECPFTTTWNGSSWSNGAPNDFTSVIINGNYNTSTNGDFNSCNCTVNAGSSVTVQANDYILIDNDLTVNGTIEVLHEGSLVMVQNDGNASGTTNIHKTSTPFNQYDYMYWSSPTSNETIGSALSSSEVNRIYRFNYQNGWIFQNGATVMDVGIGYIAMGDTSGTFPKTQSVVFDGIVNNGTIPVPIIRGPGEFENWNLIGNPYPSAINAGTFLDDPRNSSIVSGTIYLWTHNTQISESNPGPDKFNYATNDYATYTSGTGGVQAGSGGVIPNGFIASGQGFFIQAITAGSVIFDNSMRVINNNNQLFRTNSKKSTLEKDRIWLDLKNENGVFSQILIGFIEGATDNLDRSYDGIRFDGGSYASFYSIVENQNLAIQGKKPITEKENIKLGFYSYINEGDSLKISVNNIEGKINEYNAYLKDNLLGVTHDLKIGDYSFVMEKQGVFNDRFELILTKSSVLDIEENALNPIDLILRSQENTLNISTTNGTLIKDFKAFDLLGKLIVDQRPNKDEFTVNTSNLSTGTVLIINATLENNQKISKKFLIH